MNINQIAKPGILEVGGQKHSQSLIKDLGNTFGNLLDEVNQAQLTADKKIEEFATSPQKDLHGTMIAMEKADISLRMMLQVRSKLTNAYHEIMRMQF
ncbi:MAG: flagellar hook-basal body complex protein FliE [Deltaproteobacteria bacterium]|nr:flagellar hook-basal body complex protein FliE [Deltaproteobacteria bacterium]